MAASIMGAVADLFLPQKKLLEFWAPLCKDTSIYQKCLCVTVLLFLPPETKIVACSTHTEFNCAYYVPGTGLGPGHTYDTVTNSGNRTKSEEKSVLVRDSSLVSHPVSRYDGVKLIFSLWR